MIRKLKEDVYKDIMELDEEERAQLIIDFWDECEADGNTSTGKNSYYSWLRRNGYDTSLYEEPIYWADERLACDLCDDEFAESIKRPTRARRLKESTYDNGYLHRFADALKDRFSVANEERGAYECSFDVVAYSDDNLERFVYRYFDGREDQYTVDIDGPYECHYTVTIRDEL